MVVRQVKEEHILLKDHIVQQNECLHKLNRIVSQAWPHLFEKSHIILKNRNKIKTAFPVQTIVYGNLCGSTRMLLVHCR